MGDIPLPLDRFNADTYHTALDDLVKRYWNKKEPVHYKQAAINLNESTCSSCLKYFSEIGLIEVEKAGVYIPGEEAANYIRKEGDAKARAIANLDELLDSYAVYPEAKFLIEQGSYDEEKLAAKTTGQLDIDEGSVSKVQTAVSIFKEFGLLEADEDGILSINRSAFESSEGVTEDSKEPEQPFQGNVEEIVDIDDLELPPGRGDPEKLIEIVDVLSSGGSHSKSDIIEDSSVGKSSVNDVLKYGVRLGFIEKVEDGYELTEAGFDLPFTSGEEELQKLFRQAILSYDVYCALIFQMSKRYLSEGENFNTPSILREMRTTFGFREVSENRLKRSITTLFQSLEQAGVGNYVQGQGAKPTRLEVEQRDIESIKEEIIIERRPEQQPADESPSQTILGDSGNQTEAPEETKAEDGEVEKSENQVEASAAAGNEEQTEKTQLRGPSLRISKFRVQNFRNVRDTGSIDLENVTTLIGKNESGKTSTLEAIAYFSEDQPLDDRDISNDIDLSNTDPSDLPIVTLEFQLDEEAIEEHYPESTNIGDADLPLEVTQTKYADGSYDRSISADVNKIDPPVPEILYYKDYSTISDEAMIEEIRDGKNDTFQNLIKISGLDLEALERDDLEKYNAIEKAEGEIETKLNGAWSQKDVEVDLKWNDSTETIKLLIKDQIDPKEPGSERTLTYPSQRSEGFQWFLSFYINLLAETENTAKHTKILLLDDPAVKLHPEGKQDWLESVNEIGEEQQIVFSSHSPYLIDKNYPSRVRAVEDTPNNGTRIKQDIFGADDDTLEPLRNALGVDLGSSPFVSGRQVLVEGPTEYYVVTAVANYLHNVLDRDIFDWPGISVMPVRGAPDVIGKASWLASEDINYSIVLDSDPEGRRVEEKIQNHHEDIDDERVVLLKKGAVEDGLVIEDMFAPELYVSAFNAEYEDYTSELEDAFELAEVEKDGHLSWQIGDLEYDGTELPDILEDYLSQQPVSEELANADGDIELRKRQIAERIASKLNNAKVDDSHLRAFNPLFGDIGSALDAGNRR